MGANVVAPPTLHLRPSQTYTHDSNAGWPLSFIDWDAAADALRMDYTEIDFDGVTYWVR